MAKKSPSPVKAPAAAKKTPGPKLPKTPQALAKKVQSLRSRRAKAQDQIATLNQRIEDADAQLDALVAAVVSGS